MTNDNRYAWMASPQHMSSAPIREGHPVVLRNSGGQEEGGSDGWGQLVVDKGIIYRMAPGIAPDEQYPQSLLRV